MNLTLPFSHLFWKTKMKCSLASISPASKLAALSSNQQFVNRTVSYIHRHLLIQLVRTSIISFCSSFSETYFFTLSFFPYSLSIRTSHSSSLYTFLFFPFYIFTFPLCSCHSNICQRPTKIGVAPKGTRSQEPSVVAWLAGLGPCWPGRVPLSVHCNTPAMPAIPMCLCKSSKIIGLLLCTDF